MTDYFTMIMFSTVFIAGMGLGIQMIVGAKEIGGTAWFFVPFACLLIFLGLIGVFTIIYIPLKILMGW